MNGHVLHLSWLHRVLPGAWVDVGRSLYRTTMSRMLVSPLYAIRGGWLNILATSVRAHRRLQKSFYIPRSSRGGSGD